MTPLAKQSVRKTIFEVFENARTHSGSNFVFACGQCFPILKTIDFTIVDLGVTIKENVDSFFKSKSQQSPDFAIEWALIEQNSTKDDLSGGFGLSFLKSFVEQNNGKLQIYSDNEFWELKNKTITKKITYHKLKGTLVNIEININDSALYFMSSEIVNKNQDLF